MQLKSDKSNKEVKNNVNNVNGGLKVSLDVNFDRMNLMKFDENGRIVPKFGQDDCDARTKLMHAPLLEPILTTKKLELKTASSPEKFN